MNLKNLNSKSILIIILILGAFLRFYKLDWGEGLFTHPDEYHIVISINQLSPNQMNPHFFSYGTVVIYLIYFTKLFFTGISPFLIGRFYSAFFSILTIFIVYKIAKFALIEKYAIITAFLVAVTPGLIQQAHFATPESILTFFILSSLLFFLKFINDNKLKFLFLSSIFLGLGLGTKIVASLFLPVILLGIVFKFWGYPVKLIFFSLIYLFICALTFAASSPFVFLDYPAWRSSFNYENAVARGETLVFYTRQFIETTPFLFQFEKSLLFALGTPLLIFSALGFILIIFHLLRNFRLDSSIILITFLSLLIPNSLLFAKWIRFLAPTLPFFAIFASFSLQQINNKFRSASFAFTSLLLSTTTLWSLAFFSIYLKQDIRITANNWIKSQLPVESTYLVEGGNTVDLPLTGSPKISIDFYALEDNSLIRKSIAESLEKSDYFIIQSRRVFLNHQRLPDLYPKTAYFYDALFNGQLGFEEIKEFHSYPSLPFFGSNIELPDELAEETWSVFDHPVIRIFQKKIRLTKEDYEKILEQ